MKKLTALLAVAVTFLLNASAIFATGNVYGPYNPYEHKPIPTGFEDTSIFYIGAAITFITGMVILSTVKRLKNEQSA